MVYPIGKRVLPPIINLWVKRVNGLENMPKKGAFIIAANHESYMDHFFILGTFIRYLDRKIYHLAKKEYFDMPLKRMWHAHWGALPVDREKGGDGALKWAVSALKRGRVIAIHPEGTRSPDGKLMRAKTGVARLALYARVPVVPVGLEGAFEILPKTRYFPRFKRAIISIGKPIYFDKYYNKPVTRKLLRQMTTRIMTEIGKLCNQKYNFD